MADTFAQNARRLAGASSRLLGWPPDWFWRATPTELATILLGDGEWAGDGVSRRELEHMMESDRNGR